MKRIVVSILVMCTFFYTAAQKPKVVAKPTVVKGPFKNLLDSFSYAAGYAVATNMKTQKVNSINPLIMQKAIDDVYKGKKSLLTQEQMNACLQKQSAIFTKESAAQEIARGVNFLKENKKRAAVITLPSGLQYEVITRAPDSATVKPRAEDTVVVNYIGSFIDGREFENSIKNGQPAVFKVTEVIRGWTEILQLMRTGDKWKVYIPTEMAYFLNPRDPNQIPPGAALIFEITLEGIKPNNSQ